MGKKKADPRMAAMQAAQETIKESNRRMAAVPLSDREKIQRLIKETESPELVGLLEDLNLGEAELASVYSDPRFRSSQMEALAGIEEAAEKGFTEEDLENFRKLQEQTGATEKARRASIDAEMAQRGMGGSGQSYLSKLMSSQAASQREAQAGRDITARAVAAKNAALKDQMNVAGQLRSADLGEKTDRARARQQRDEFSALNRQQIAGRNLGMRQAYSDKAFDTRNRMRQGLIQEEQGATAERFRRAQGVAAGMTNLAQMQGQTYGAAGPSKGKAALSGAASGAMAAAPTGNPYAIAGGALLGGTAGYMSAEDGGVKKEIEDTKAKIESMKEETELMKQKGILSKLQEKQKEIKKKYGDGGASYASGGRSKGGMNASVPFMNQKSPYIEDPNYSYKEVEDYLLGGKDYKGFGLSPEVSNSDKKSLVKEFDKKRNLNSMADLRKYESMDSSKITPNAIKNKILEDEKRNLALSKKMDSKSKISRDPASKKEADKKEASWYEEMWEKVKDPETQRKLLEGAKEMGKVLNPELKEQAVRNVKLGQDFGLGYNPSYIKFKDGGSKYADGTDPQAAELAMLEGKTNENEFYADKNNSSMTGDDYAKMGTQGLGLLNQIMGDKGAKEQAAPKLNLNSKFFTQPEAKRIQFSDGGSSSGGMDMMQGMGMLSQLLGQKSEAKDPRDEPLRLNSDYFRGEGADQIKYAHGGRKMAYEDGDQGTIIPGEDYSGDELEDRINSGEMVLNVKQQERLNSMLQDYKRLKRMHEGVEDGKRVDDQLEDEELSLNPEQQDAMMELIRGEREVDEYPEDSILKMYDDELEDMFKHVYEKEDE